ncbi:MAG: HD family hydrolase [Pseudomonadota bacterium]
MGPTDEKPHPGPARGHNERPRARAWQRMLSGRRLDLLNPHTDDIAIEDIAHGLARVARWNGQTSGAHSFSVAHHSLLVETLLETMEPGASIDAHRAALLHDAAEYVIGDLISPFKGAIGDTYKQVERRLQHAIHARFEIGCGLDDATAAAIKRADGVAAYVEATALAGFTESEAAEAFAVPAPAPFATGLATLNALQPLATPQVQARFLQRFAALNEAMA